MRNIKLIVKFAGGAYHGWQIQKNGITVQEVLSKAIASVTGELSPKLIGCGRTDAGVHAAGYVVSFKTASQIPAERLPLALNSRLPEDIVCIDAQDVDEDFHAADSAVKKRYTYRILNSTIPDPFVNAYAYQVKFPLDIKKMREAASHFEGTHDFVGFAAAGYTVKTTVRTIYSIEISRESDLIYIDVIGNGFLYNMVRIIAGTLIDVGRGEILPRMIPEIISSRDRKRAGATAPAKGLCLTEVYY